MRRISFFFIALLLIQAASVFAQTQTANLSPVQISAFEDFVKTRMAMDKVPGISVAYQKGDVVWAKGYGYADLENKLPARPESMYRMASVAKPMTAVAILKLVDAGKIDLDAEVQTYVPYFPKKKFPVTVRQLLAHIGGISHYKDYEKEGRIKVHMNTREAIAIFQDFDLVAEPGTRHSYSSYGYNLLGAVIEGASGKPYGEYMRENVWGPLGMDTIRMDSPSDVIPNRVRGYALTNSQVVNAEFVDISSRFGGGGSRATVYDMIKFAKSVSNEKLLSPASRELVKNSMATKSGQLVNYSAGWSTSPTNGRFTLSHSGGQQETSTYLYTFPSRDLTIAVASNLEGANTSPYVARLFELLTGETWNFNPYLATDQTKLPLSQAMQIAFETGRAHFEKTGKAFASDQETTAAFATFNQMIGSAALTSANQRELMQKVNRTRNAQGSPMITVGSYIAQKLNEKYGTERLRDYSNTGAIGFFNDYAALAGTAPEFRLADDTNKTIAVWNTVWLKTNTSAYRQMTISADSDLDKLGAQLKRDFAGASVYPNLGGGLLSAVDQLISRGDVLKAWKASGLAAEFYPASDRALAYHGLMLIVSGEKGNGKEFLQRSMAINPNGNASPGSMNSFAYALEGLGKRASAIELLLVSIDIYPKEANLYDTIGEMYLKEDKKDKALEYYQKAIATNDKYPNAEKAKEIVQQLTTKQ